MYDIKKETTLFHVFYTQMQTIGIFKKRKKILGFGPPKLCNSDKMNLFKWIEYS